MNQMQYNYCRIRTQNNLVPGTEGKCQLGGQEGNEGICGQEGSEGRGQAAGQVGRGKLLVSEENEGSCQAAGQLGRGIDAQPFPEAYLQKQYEFFILSCQLLAHHVYHEYSLNSGWKPAFLKYQNSEYFKKCQSSKQN